MAIVPVAAYATVLRTEGGRRNAFCPTSVSPLMCNAIISEADTSRILSASIVVDRQGRGCAPCCPWCALAGMQT